MIQTAKRDSRAPGFPFRDGLSERMPQSLEPKDVRNSVVKGDSLSKFVDLQMPPRNYSKYSAQKK